MNLLELKQRYGLDQAQEQIWSQLWNEGGDYYRSSRRPTPWFKEFGKILREAYREHDIAKFNMAMAKFDAEGMDTASHIDKWSRKFHTLLYRCHSCNHWEEGNSYVRDFVAHRYCDRCINSQVSDSFVWSEVHQRWVTRRRAMRIYGSPAAAYDEGDPLDWGDSERGLSSSQYYRIADLSNVWVRGRPDYNGIFGTYYRSGIELPYHSSKQILGHIPSLYDDESPRLLMGFELEVQSINGNKTIPIREIRKFRDDLFAQTKIPYVECEHDGSLGDTGFEIVSSYTGLDVHEQLIRRMLALPSFAGLRSHDTTACGLHVHLDKAGISIFHAAKLISFIHDPANLPLMVTIGRRTPQECERYAKFADKKQVYNWSKQHYDAVLNAADATRRLTERYEAVNMGPEKTIEFRLYRGTTRFTTLMACLEFSRAAWLFARDSSLKEMSTAHFLRYIERADHHRETRYLRRRLKRNGFEVAYKPQEITYTIAETFNMRKAA